MKRFCLLVPDKNESYIRKYYTDTLGLDNTLCIPLWFMEGKARTTAQEKRDWFKNIVVPKLEDYECKYVLICDAEYFKAITGKTKAEPYVGSVENIDSSKWYYAFVPTYNTAFKDPIRTRERINCSLSAVLRHSNGSYVPIGTDIIKTAYYPKTSNEIHLWLLRLLGHEALTCDIETWSLKHYDAGIASICFCWNQEEGICFKVDNSPSEPNRTVRKYLAEFFINYKGKLIFHNITFDCYVLTYQLFMNGLHDYRGMLDGLFVLLKNFEDTKLIAYLATNSCGGNVLGLKSLAHEFAGNWAQEEITNLETIPEDELLKYNLIDGLATWYVYNKFYDKMVDDEQLNIYETIFKPACKDIIQMQLTGLPIDMNAVTDAKNVLEWEEKQALEVISSSSLVRDFMKSEAEEWVFKKNETLKKKRVTFEDFKETFNPASGKQLKRLLYDFLGLPIVATTETGEPSTSKKDLEKLLNKTKNQKVKALIQALIDWKDVIKILTAFIPAFMKAKYDEELDCWFLYGNFNLGGTVSGRLSSSNINLQQLPATGSKYAKLIKSCFRPPKGWLFVGLDFSSLEDRISALTTKDPEKLKVYTDGYDGHCLRSYTYFKEQMPDISLAQDTEKCYKAKVGSTYIYFHAKEQIEYLGQMYTGEELYAVLTNKRI